ncbi:Pre-mRNA-splicing factor cwf19 [Rhodosporidiobolus nylandii]
MGSHSRSDDRDSSKKHSRSSHRSSRDDDGHRDHKRHRSSREDEDGDKRRSSSSRHAEKGSSSNRSHRSDRDRDRHHSSSSSSRRKSSRDEPQPAADDDDEWVEKPAEGAAPAASAEEPARAPVDTVGSFSVGSMPTAQGLRRLEAEDMTEGYGEGDVGGSSSRGGGMFGIGGAEGEQGEADFFGGFGTERKRREKKEKVDPTDMMGQSSRELNKTYWQGAPAAQPSTPAAVATGSPAPGSSGSAWRMTKLRRTYEAAEEEGRPIEEVALERYGTLEAFEEAREERRVLDERGARRPGPGGRRDSGRPSTPLGIAADGGGRRFVFTEMEGAGGDPSRPSSRQAFRRPGEAPTPQQPPGGLARSASSSSVASAGGSRPQTPVPSVFTPSIGRILRNPSQLSQSTVLNPDPTFTGPAISANPASGSSKPILSQSELNKLQARVLKAKLMESDDAAALEKEYEAELARSQAAGPAVAEHEGMQTTLGGSAEQGRDVQVLPTLDARGRLYDTGIGTQLADEQERERKEKGRRGKKEKAFQSHDPKTGEVLRLAADDDALSLSDLVRQERFAGGMNDQRSLDRDVADRIATDARYNTDLDYQDENAEKLARKKMKSETMKRQFAINDYARTKKALDSCTLCFSDEGDPPKSAVVALGTRTYLGLMDNEELVPGHCRIVPAQHHLSCLEIEEEEGWDEIKNFMKTLMQMFAAEDKGVVFFETITTHKYQKHSYIECIPVEFDLFDQLPIYFQEAISTSESEWSQHKKLINFTPARPFRRSLVPNLPYFAVQFDYKGEKGYGHVIEGIDDAPDRDLDGEITRQEMGTQGGGEFPTYFAQEIIGNLLHLPPKSWRKPRRLDRRDNAARVEAFRKKYDKYDWTKALKA